MVRSNEIYYSLLITHYSFDSLSHQALAALPTLPTPVMLSEAKHLSVSTDWEILHYVQNDIVSEWYVATKIIPHYSFLIPHYSLLTTHYSLLITHFSVRLSLFSVHLHFAPVRSRCAKMLIVHKMCDFFTKKCLVITKLFLFLWVLLRCVNMVFGLITWFLGRYRCFLAANFVVADD